MNKKILLIGLISISSLSFAQKNEKNEKNIDGVTITKVKKAIEQKPDRTIFDFSEQPHLNSGSLSDGLKKLPGLIISDVAGMIYQGKQLDVYMNGRPLNIGSNDLNSYLEGLPANSIERVEIITQPGAEFPATSGGAIINIITNKNAQNYLSATYSGRYAFTNYDKYRNRVNNSLLLSAKNKFFGWQLNVGQNYRENFQNSLIDVISKANADRVQRGYFLKSGITFDIGNDKLLLNYDINKNNNTNQTLSSGYYPNFTINPAEIVNFSTNDAVKNENLRQEANIIYQKRFDDKSKKLDFNFNFSNFDTNFSQNGIAYSNSVSKVTQLANNSNQKIGSLKVDYTQPIKLLDEGKLSIGGVYEKLFYETSNGQFTNLDYQRQTASTYLELQAKLKKFDFILGTRAENYDIFGKTRFINIQNAIETKDLENFKEFRLFPNASLQYNFAKQVYFLLNYNKKIQLPNVSSLNPNNTNYQTGSFSFGGNPFLKPTIFNNFEAKISAFDYAFIGYNLSIATNQNSQIAEKIYPNPNQTSINGTDAFVMRNGFVNLSEMRIHNFNFGMPIPFMLFTKGLKETLKMNVNPDKMNFLYVYAAYQFHDLPDFDSKGFWMVNLMAQFILPKDIKFVANYGDMSKGNWFYYTMQKPWYHSLDLTATKKFFKDQLTVSIFANDILKTQENAVISNYKNANVFLGNKFDAQNFGISLNYKIPTKNKLAKEGPNILNKDKKEDTNGGMTPNQ